MSMRIKINSKELYNTLNVASNFNNDDSILQLKSRGILHRFNDASQTALYNCLIPEDSMVEYELGEYSRLGIDIGDMKDVVPNDDSIDIVLTIKDHELAVTYGGREYKVPIIDPDTVKGVPEVAPDLDLPVKIWGKMDWLTDFAKENESYVFNGNSGQYWLSANEGVLVLWGKRDDYELKDTIHWEDFDDYEINWSKATPDDKLSMGVDPTKRNRIEVTQSNQFTSSMEFFGNKARFEFGHGMPIRAVTETENGVRHSFIIPPRFPRESGVNKVPDRAIDDRGVV